MFVFDDQSPHCNIGIIGIGDAGRDVINTMLSAKVSGVKFKIIEYNERTQYTIKQVSESVKNGDVIFIIGDLGEDFTVDTAAFIAAKACEAKVLTVGVMTKPDGNLKVQLEKVTDSLIIVNDKGMIEKTTQAIAEMILKEGFYAVDFADIRYLMSNSGIAYAGSGSAKGKDRAKTATQLAVNNLLLNNAKFSTVRGLLVIISVSHRIGLVDVNEFNNISSIIQNKFGEVVDCYIGDVCNEQPEGQLIITIIATGNNIFQAEEK